MRDLKIAAVALFGAVTTACVSTQELPLAPNVVQLDTHASGALFTGQATTQTMRRAAELTLQNGYTHFRLENAQMSQGSQLAAVYSTESGTLCDRLRRRDLRDGLRKRPFDADL